MRIIAFLFFIFYTQILCAQFSRTDKTPTNKLKSDIEALVSPEFEGRLTGTKGADLAATFIEDRFKEMGIAPYKNNYKWEFTARTGLTLDRTAYFKINDENLTLGKDFIFLPYSQGNVLKGSAMPNVNEIDNVWFISAKQIDLLGSSNPQKRIYESAKYYLEQGAASVIIYNDIDPTQDLSSLNLNNFDMLDKPVVFLKNHVYNAEIKPRLRRDWIYIDAKIVYADENTTGKNVLGFIDNKAALTIVIAANYDHVGNAEGAYEGADNNASGVAGLLQIAESIKGLRFTRYNYLFAAFGGKEQDMQGSSSFLTQQEGNLNAFSCMINLDKIGRLNDKTKAVYLSGYGTAAIWEDIVKVANKNAYNFMVDTSGLGFSDYNSFYKKNIPVLSISSGYHEDILTARDNLKKINMVGLQNLTSFVENIVTELEKKSKPNFQKTQEMVLQLNKTKRNLGIIPDLTFPNSGVRVNYCYPNKLAYKAGLKCGDVITKIGPLKIVDFEDYLKAMNRIDKDVETTLLIKRDQNEYKFFVTFQ